MPRGYRDYDAPIYSRCYDAMRSSGLSTGQNCQIQKEAKNAHVFEQGRDYNQG